MSLFTLLPVIKIESIGTMYVYCVYTLASAFAFEGSFVTNYVSRTIGGLLMFITGLLYLIFEESITRRAGRVVSAAGSRTIMGLQVILYSGFSLVTDFIVFELTFNSSAWYCFLSW